MARLDPAVDLEEELVDEESRRRPSSAPARARTGSRRRGRPAMPKSASPASPGPFTAQPITATSNACGYAFSRSSTTTARFSTPTLSRPQDGQAIITGPRSRRPSALRISQATSTSSHGIGGERDAERVADPVREQRADPDRALDRARERRSRLGDAEVQRIRHLRGEHPVGADHRRHVGCLDRDLEVAVVELLEQLDLLECGGDERLGLVLACELLQVRRQRAGVRADPHRDAGLLCGLDDELHLVRARRCCPG